MSKEEEALLASLYDSHRTGAFAVACDGSNRAPAHQLEKRRLARWVGENWGSNFWQITEEGVTLAVKLGVDVEAK